MKRLWIFGDSYSDLNYVFGTEQDKQSAWPIRIAQTIKTVNHSLMGTGPDWSLELLMQNLHIVDPDDGLLFIPSFPTRFNLKNFYKRLEYQSNSTQLYSSPDASSDFKINHVVAKIFIENLYRYMYTDDALDREIVKSIATVNLLAGCFKQILIWPVFEPPPFYNMKLHDNVVIPDQGLSEISKKDNPVLYKTPDPRPNHLSTANHEIMYTQLINWIQTGTVPDTTQFVSCSRDPA